MVFRENRWKFILLAKVITSISSETKQKWMAQGYEEMYKTKEWNINEAF